MTNLMIRFSIVEIDESSFRRKQEYGQGGRPDERRGPWVFGEHRRGLTVLFIVDRCDANTLLPLIRQYIVPETTIYSDKWMAHHSLSQLEYHHCTVNHSQEFVSEDGVHTNSIEGFWGQAKGRLKKCMAVTWTR